MTNIKQWHCNFTHTNKRRVLSEITKDGSTRGIAEFLDEKDESEVLANARLIAAAPDLLEACKRAIACMRDEYPEHVLQSGDYPAFQALESAINKAEGL